MEKVSMAKIVVGLVLFALTGLSAIGILLGIIDPFVATLIICAYIAIQMLIIDTLIKEEGSRREWGGVILAITIVGMILFILALAVTYL